MPPADQRPIPAQSHWRPLARGLRAVRGVRGRAPRLLLPAGPQTLLQAGLRGVSADHYGLVWSFKEKSQNTSTTFFFFGEKLTFTSIRVISSSDFILGYIYFYSMKGFTYNNSLECQIIISHFLNFVLVTWCSFCFGNTAFVVNILPTVSPRDPPKHPVVFVTFSILFTFFLSFYQLYFSFWRAP